MTVEQARKAVFKEMERFDKALPELQKTHQGQWVVYKGGEITSSHATEEEAYQAGLDAFGRMGGHVVVQVISQEPTPLSAGVMFGVA
jgi:predicted small secreted protein